jgi:hypothetical protein
MNLCVIAPDFGDVPSPEAHVLMASGARVGINVHLFGQGRKWSTFRARVEEALATIRAMSTGVTHVLMTDSFDALFLRTAWDIRHEYFHAGSPPMLLSAEKTCWPDVAMLKHYPEAPTAWAFINGGGWMGERSYLLEKLPEVLGMDPDTDDDQLLITKASVSGKLPSAPLDYNCRGFQTIANSEKDVEYLPEHKLLLNNKTGTYPCIGHWNGRTPGREAVWEAIGSSA